MKADMRKIGSRLKIHIERMHLEEDAGKNVHDGLPDVDKYSYVDLNRAGTPLGEIVTGPDFRTSWQAYDYVNHVRRVLQWVGASDADMEKGNLRCEANVSVERLGRIPFNNKVELKESEFRSIYAKGDRIRDRTSN